MAEQQKFIEKLPVKYPIHFVEGAYEKERFYEMAKGLEDCPEGGERCFLCYELRLREAAELAKKMQMDYFTTTLSISPLKNAEKLNEIGDALAEEYGIAYLNSDFMDTSVLWNYPSSMACTGSIIADVFFQKIRETGRLP